MPRRVSTEENPEYLPCEEGGRAVRLTDFEGDSRLLGEGEFLEELKAEGIL